MASVTFDQATHVYPGTDEPAVDSLDLTVDDGEFMVLVGPSGCGKSTSLRLLAGLEEVTSGAIRIGDRDVTDLPPKDRDIAMVFQNYALYPHMSVAENMGFALKIAGVSKSEIAKRVQEAAGVLGLEQYLSRKPKALSGGRARAAGVLDGRAAVEPRCQAAGRNAQPDRGTAKPSRHHHGLRHPRPDRGPNDGRSGCRTEGRYPPAGRHPPNDV